MVKISSSEQLNNSWNKSSNIIAILNFFTYANKGFVNNFFKKYYVIFNDIICWYISNWFLYFAYFKWDFVTIFTIFKKENISFIFFFTWTVRYFWLTKKFQLDTSIHYKIRCTFRVVSYNQKMCSGWYVWVHIFFLICM